MNKYIPNSFQTPNAIVDEIMNYLSGNEMKVLLFTVRHIYGWQDRIILKTAYISLTMYEKGFGEYSGVGLSRPTINTILSTLTKYRVLIREGKPTSKGQQWSIGENPDIEGLKNRNEEQRNATKPKLQKARKQKSASKTIKPVVKDFNQYQLNGLTDTGKTVLPKQTQEQTQLKTMSSGDDSDTFKIPKETRDTIFNHIALKVWNLKPDALQALPEKTRKRTSTRIGMVTSVVCDIHTSKKTLPLAKHIDLFVDEWYPDNYPDQPMIKDANKWAEYYLDFYDKQKAKRNPSSKSGDFSAYQAQAPAWKEKT